MSTPGDYEQTPGGAWVHRSDVCPECNGDGCAWEGWDCEHCDGAGYVVGASLLDDDDLDDDRDDYDIWQPCDCAYCNCFNQTEYGGTCMNCQNGAHQG